MIHGLKFGLIFFLDPPSIAPLRNLTVKPGDNITLNCVVSGNPSPSVSWTKVSTGIQHHDEAWGRTNIDINTLGEYRCNASNSCGQESDKLTLAYVGRCMHSLQYCEKKTTKWSLDARLEDYSGNKDWCLGPGKCFNSSVIYSTLSHLTRVNLSLRMLLIFPYRRQVPGTMQTKKDMSILWKILVSL